MTNKFTHAWKNPNRTSVSLLIFEQKNELFNKSQ